MIVSICPMTNLTFTDWLQNELTVREWTQADLSRRSGVSASQITRVMSGERGIGNDGLVNIARALNLPAVNVFRAAGILPPVPETTEEIEMILHEISKLPKEDQAEILAFVRMKSNLRSQREKVNE